MVASFDGDGAGGAGPVLADELRTQYRLTAYVNDRTFDHSDGKNSGRGLDNYGAPLRTRYQQEQAHEFAVLVGDFPSIDDPAAQKTLERIKTLPSKVLSGETPDSAMDEVRQFSSKMVGKVSGHSPRGPDGPGVLHAQPAFAARVLRAQGRRRFVAKMNQGVEHSLLDCPGRYTVQVATFRGKTILQTSNEQPKRTGRDRLDVGQEQSRTARRGRGERPSPDRSLRRHGYDAYEFHDRTESIVTIGSFDHVGERLANGQLAPSPEVQTNHPDVRRRLRHAGRSAHRRRHPQASGMPRT